MLTRRTVLRAGALAGIGCLCPAADRKHNICCITPEIEPAAVAIEPALVKIDLARAPSLREPGSSVNLIDEKRGLDLILVHAEPRRFCVLSGLCTHYPRPLTYLPARKVLQCNNFNHSTFDLEGKVVKGPATKPIQSYRTSLDGRTLSIDLLETWTNPIDGSTFIRLPAGFWMSRTEVTRGQFRRFTVAAKYLTTAERAQAQRTWRSPGFPQSDNDPVVWLTFDDALAYAHWAGVDLPTEAEWTLAMRAGSTTKFPWGDTQDDRYMWHRGNSDNRTHPVGTKLPNAWGLHDMVGNAWEYTKVATPDGRVCPNEFGTLGAAWTRCPQYKMRNGSLIDAIEVSLGPVRTECSPPSSTRGPVHWDDDRGFRCIRREQKVG